MEIPRHFAEIGMLRKAARPSMWRPPPPPTPTLTSLLCFHSCPPAQQLSFLHRGLLSNLYLHTQDCPVPLLQWLFQVRSADLPLDGGSALAQHPGQHCCGEDGHVPPLGLWVLLGVSHPGQEEGGSLW